MNADGSNERQLTALGLSEDPDWCPDGSQIAFQSSWEGDFEIYTLHVQDSLHGRAGPRPRRLTNTRAGDFGPSWGPGPLHNKDISGSWFAALAESGILDDAARSLALGTGVLLEDGWTGQGRVFGTQLYRGSVEPPEDEEEIPF